MSPHAEPTRLARIPAARGPCSGVRVSTCGHLVGRVRSRQKGRLGERPAWLARRLLRGAALSLALMLGACVTEHPNGSPLYKPDMAEASRLNTQLGLEYAREGQWALAMDKLKLAITERDDYAPAHAALAYVYARHGDNDLAEQEYRRALSLDADDPDTQNNFGVFLCGRGRSAEAQKLFRRAAANRNYSTPEAAWTNAGICPGTSQADAEADFMRALQANPQFPEALQQMAQLSFERKQYLRARAFEQRYRKVAKPGPGMLLLSARTERALGETARADNYETQLVQQYPDSPEASQLSATTTTSP